MIRRLLPIALVVLLQLVNCQQPIKEKHISALVTTKWSETPLLLEASEFVFRNDPNSFWKFATDLAKNSKFRDPETMNDEIYVREVFSHAAKHISPMQLDLLKLSLLTRTYSPAIEMSRQLAEEALINGKSESKCLTFVDVNGQVTCDIDKIVSLIDGADTSKKPFVYQHDKYYQFSTKPGGATKKVTVILYAQIGTPQFENFHQRLSDIGSERAIDYILRHNYEMSTEESRKIGLSGYGIELDIKSTEYKAKDDANVNAAESESVQEKQAEADQPVQGFMFDTLKEQNPDLGEKLDEFRKHLVESQLEMAPLKAWQMQDLSLQAAQKIIDAPTGQEALMLLQDLSQNFPLRARSLSKISVRSELKKTFKSQRQVRASLLLSLTKGDSLV